MAKKITWSDDARADVRAIDRSTALRLLRGLARFAITGSGDVKQLEGYQPVQFRLRLGDYRIRFRKAGDSIEIVRVLHRSEAYQ
jgi:mRNA-degrading endonuclease RelE of RelBE toxin-antitoxin system